MRWIIWTLVLLGGGCVTTPVEPDFSKAERMVEVHDWGPFGPWFRFVVADSVFLYECRSRGNPEGGGSNLTTTELKWFKLTPEAEAETWAVIDSLGIAEWKEQYLPEDLGVQIFDGTSWVVRFRFDGVETQSSGFNVYPALNPIGDPVLDFEVDQAGNVSFRENAYRRLLNMLLQFEKNSDRLIEKDSAVVEH